jgi:hypothetical protein
MAHYVALNTVVYQDQDGNVHTVKAAGSGRMLAKKAHGVFTGIDQDTAAKLVDQGVIRVATEGEAVEAGFDIKPKSTPKGKSAPKGSDGDEL